MEKQPTKVPQFSRRGTSGWPHYTSTTMSNITAQGPIPCNRVLDLFVGFNDLSQEYCIFVWWMHGVMYGIRADRNLQPLVLHIFCVWILLTSQNRWAIFWTLPKGSRKLPTIYHPPSSPAPKLNVPRVSSKFDGGSIVHECTPTCPGRMSLTFNKWGIKKSRIPLPIEVSQSHYHLG